MKISITNDLINCLMISSIIGIINMSIIQKFKKLSIFNDYKNVFLLNLFLSFIVGIPFSIIFFNIELHYSIWISIFSFVGVSNLYDMLKKVNIINKK